MDSSESSERQLSNNKEKLDTTPSKQSDSDYAYEDDFEELDSFIQEKSRDSSSSNSTSVTPSTENSGRRDVFHKSDSGVSDSDSQQEKGQQESSGDAPTEKESSAEDSADSSQKLSSSFDDPQSDDSEPEPEDDPPEYNVKERLKELNAELAMEPDPDDREHRVGFKQELVDLVAPPPEVSDEEDSSRKTPIDDKDKEKADSKGQGGGDKKKQFVVERDGKFDVVADHELTSSERAMFNIPHEEGNKSKTDANDNQIRTGGGDNRDNMNNSNSQSNKENMHPMPPAKPRPNTANGYSRRNVRPAQSPRPQTATSSHYVSRSNTLQNFNHVSQYAMSPSEKERALERARLREQQRKEEEERNRQEEEYRRQEAEDAFQAWLRRKQEENRKRRQEEEERKKKEAKEDRSQDSESDDSEEAENQGYPNIPYLEPFEPIIRLKSKENEEAFKGWLSRKQMQTKREKLLKKREEQEVRDGYYVRSREECDAAYKEWLKKKYAEFRRQRMAEKQRVRSFRSQARKSRKQQMMARAVRQSQAFRYVDYYGYRF